MKPTRVRDQSDWDLAGDLDDNAALGELFRRHRDFVFRVALQRLGGIEDAEEVAQEVFYRLARKGRPRFRRGKFTTWLFRVTQNAAIDHHRRLQRSPEPEPVSPSHRDQSEISYTLRETLRALEDLPRRQREVVGLRILEGFSEAETAALLGISKGSVKTHLSRGLNRLNTIFAATENNS